MLPEITSEELSASLDQAAQEVLDAAGIHRPPVDAMAVAEALQITVAIDDRQPGRARFVRLGGMGSQSLKATVLLRPDPRFERRQWALAHEIGEDAAWRVFAILGVDPREAAPNAREQVANRFACRLLLPAGWFAGDAADCQWDLIALKSRYRTASHELIARRMLELPPPIIISIFDQGQLHFRRSNVPGQVPSLSSVEARIWRQVHQRNQPLGLVAPTQTVQGWPIHEPGWKREILRSEVDPLICEPGETM